MARKFELKNIPLGNTGGDIGLEYRDMLLQILRVPSDPRAGINYEEMGRRWDLIKKINNTKDDTIVFEDAEWREVTKAFKAYPFAGVFSGIVQMGGELMNAETVKLESVKAG